MWKKSQNGIETLQKCSHLVCHCIFHFFVYSAKSFAEHKSTSRITIRACSKISNQTELHNVTGVLGCYNWAAVAKTIKEMKKKSLQQQKKWMSNMIQLLSYLFNRCALTSKREIYRKMLKHSKVSICDVTGQYLWREI